MAETIELKDRKILQVPRALQR